MFDNWKANASSARVVISENRQSSALTEKQKAELDTLESKPIQLTAKEIDRYAYLKEKEKKSKELILSDTYVGYLMEEYAYLTQGMIKIDRQFNTLEMMNGTLVEADSLIALIQAENKPYLPNMNENGEQDKIENEFLKGKPDAYLGNSLMEAEEIPDIKSRFDYPSFLKEIHSEITKAERYQVATYCLISGAKIGFIADCLTNMHDDVLEELKFKLLNKMKGKVATTESPEFVKAWEIIKKSAKFDHMKPKERVYKRKVELFSETEINFLYDQVKRGRDFLNKLHEERLKLV